MPSPRAFTPLRLTRPSRFLPFALLIVASCATARDTAPPAPAAAATSGAPAASAPAAAATQVPAPRQGPVAARKPDSKVWFGDTLPDDYSWLRSKGTPEVESYLRAENEFTAQAMKPTEPLQQKLYDELLGRIQQTDLSVPYRDGDYLYYSRTEEGKQYPVHCRKRAPPPGIANIGTRKGGPPIFKGDGPEEILLDLNAMAAGRKFLSLGEMEVSDDARLLAYSTDVTGFRQYDLHIRDLATLQTGPEQIARVDTFAWAADDKTLFYVVEEETSKRPYRLYRHVSGAAGPDALVFEEKDEKFTLQVSRSLSREYLFLTSGSHTATEVRFVAAKTPAAEWTVVTPREKDLEYYVDHRGDSFYIRANDTGRNFRFVSAPVKSPGHANWRELVAHRDPVLIADADVFADYYVLHEREDGVPHRRVVSFRTGESHRVVFPEALYSLRDQPNKVFATSTYRFRYESEVTPPSVFDYRLDTRERKLLKEQPVLGGYDRRQYVVERLLAPAPDGVKVPVSLYYRKGLRKDGSAPCRLLGYGAYGVAYPDAFNSDLISLADRGFVVALAHIRGGGDLGKPWHDAGRMLNKRNTFTDFIASAEALIAQGYTSKSRLIIEGRSAGGLLMGAVLNLRPDLFKAALVGVPFVDVIHTMLDETLPLTVGEFEEWGNPKVEAEYRYIRTYSPYDNVTAQAYPDILVTSSYNDSQVMYFEPAKWVARLRATKTDGNSLLLKMNMEPAGHGGASGRYDKLHETAFDLAWMLREVGIDH